MKTVKNLAIFVITIIIAIYAVNFFSSKNLPGIADSDSISIYFVKADKEAKTLIAPVKRAIIPDESTVKTALSELFKGPTLLEIKQGYYTEIPQETKLIGVNETSKKVIINISDNFQSGGGSDSMKTRLKQLAYTSIEAAKDKPVYLELNGQKAEYIGGEGIEVPQPLSVNKIK